MTSPTIPDPMIVNGRPSFAHLGLPRNDLQFTVRMGLHLMAFTSMRPREAYRTAGQAYIWLSRYNNMCFGDPDYSWDDEAARDLILEFWSDQ